MKQVDKELIRKILEKYAKKNCDYLKQATVLIDAGNARSMENSQLKATFSVPSPIHVKCGNHFNAVEFFICANQMLYTLSGYFASQQGLAIQEQLIDFDTFLTKRETCYIARVKEVTFRRPIDPKAFYGEIIIQKDRNRNGQKFVEAQIKFFDDNGGHAQGTMLLVMTS